MYFQIVLATIASLYHGTSAEIAPSLQDGGSSSSSGDSPSLLRVRRQGGNFVRFGRAPSSFVRIGKLDPESHNGGGESPEFMRSDRMPHMNRFIRIGRNLHEENVRGSSEEDPFVGFGKSIFNDPFAESSSFDKRSPGFVRIGKSWDKKRAPGFVRIGKDFGGDDMNGDADDLSGLGSDTDDIFQSKRSPGFVRIGKSLNDNIDEDSIDIDNEKRGSFVRIGKAASPLFSNNGDNFGDNEDDDEKRSPGFVRIGKSSDDSSDKRTPGFVRIGKSFDDELSKRAPGFVRIGKSLNNDLLPKRSPGFVRIGKSLNNDLLPKRSPGFVRIGKAIDEALAKRSPGFVRIGKSPMDLLQNKRAPGFVRIGKSNFYDDDDEALTDPLFSTSHRPERSTFADGFDRHAVENELLKRSPGFVRIGKSSMFDEPFEKRQSGFVRIGKDLLHQTDAESAQDKEMMKKNSGFVRIGKKATKNEESLLPESSERMDHSGNSRFGDKNPIRVARRGSAFVRIGKIPASAFVPLTKDIGRIFDVTKGRKPGYRRRSRNGESSFVRIG